MCVPLDCHDSMEFQSDFCRVGVFLSKTNCQIPTYVLGNDGIGVRKGAGF